MVTTLSDERSGTSETLSIVIISLINMNEKVTKLTFCLVLCCTLVIWVAVASPRAIGGRGKVGGA